MKTVNTIKKCGYTGKYYIICDDEDDNINEYYENFGRDKVIVFNKLAKSKEFDTGDLSDNRKTIVYARNASFDIAKSLNLTYFLELDDDYTCFRYRYDDGKQLGSVYVKSFDKLVDLLINFLNTTNALTVAFGQTGDMIGGFGSQLYQNRIKRKAMNSFFCDVNKQFDFLGRINEDVNSYTYYGTQGKLFMTIADVTLDQIASQSNKGGMTDVYLDGGTYLKSFFTVMYCPSCVKISVMGDGHYRFHHKVLWENTVPKIISDRFKIK